MKTTVLLSAAMSAAVTGTASADLVASFGFTELNASFDFATGEFVAEADSANGLATSGDVTAYAGGLSTALFNPGFFNAGSDASVLFRMDIVTNDGQTATAENGRIMIVDADGDTLSGSFEGQWNLRFGFGFFDGEITSALFNSAGDGIFEGPDGGSFTMPEGSLTGALSFLIMEMSDGLFQDSFTGRPASADGMLVPAPGSVALMGLGGLVMARRRR